MNATTIDSRLNSAGRFARRLLPLYALFAAASSAFALDLRCTYELPKPPVQPACAGGVELRLENNGTFNAVFDEHPCWGLASQVGGLYLKSATAPTSDPLAIALFTEKDPEGAKTKYADAVYSAKTGELKLTVGQRTYAMACQDLAPAPTPAVDPCAPYCTDGMTVGCMQCYRSQSGGW